MARPDASGRLSIRHLLRVLGWSAGDRVDQVEVSSAIVITRAPAGGSIIGIRGDLTIPAAARALAGLDRDGQIVLVAATENDTLVLHAESVIADLIAQYYARLDSADDR